MSERNWATGLRRGDRTICLRRYSTREEADARIRADHADANKLDDTTWFDMPLTIRLAPSSRAVAVLETEKARVALEVSA